MKTFRWLHAATAAALLVAPVGCDEQDFEDDSAVMEAQPSDTYQSDPTAPPPTEELQQNSQNNPLGDPNADDTLDVENPLDNSASQDRAAPGNAATEAEPAPEAEQPTPGAEQPAPGAEQPAESASGGAPAPADQSPLEHLDEQAVVEVEAESQDQP